MGVGMETSAAIYVRRSAVDDREGDNRSLAGQERECRASADACVTGFLCFSDTVCLIGENQGRVPL